MRTTLKIVLPLIVSVAAVSLFFAAYQVRTEKRVLRNDLSHRAEILGANLQESIEPLLDRPGEKNLQRIVERFSQREHLKGVVVHDAAGGTLAITSGLAPIFRVRPEAVTRAAKQDAGVGQFLPADQFSFNDPQQQIPMHVFALPLHHGGEIVGTVALFHDTSYIDEQVSRTLRDSVLNALFQTLLISRARAGAGPLDFYGAADAHGKLAAHASNRTTQRRVGASERRNSRPIAS